jgi:formylmethanofuran dehydrogenase subunit E
MVVGGFMVDLGRRSLPSGILFDVICETAACLPDAVQLLTPCSVGNQWMKVIDLGRFAVTLYDKYTGQGVRVFIDTGRLDEWPAIKEWFLKLKPKREQDRERLISEMRRAGDAVCSIQRVCVASTFLSKQPKTVVVCPLCNEAYRGEDGPVCPACRERRLPYLTGVVKPANGGVDRRA